MGHWRWRVYAACAVAALVFCGRPAWAEELENLAKKLSEMRSDVESLSTQLDLKKQQLRGELDSLSAQKTEIEVQVRKEELRVAELNAAIQRTHESVAEKAVSDDVLEPMLLEALENVRGYVRTSLPFRSHERLRELDELENQIRSGSIGSERAATRLWAFVEDELRLTRESAVDRQEVIIDGKAQLCDVVRLGMIALFFKTPSGRVGYAARDGEGWTYRLVDSDAEAHRVEELFESFRKQLKVGYFEIPNVLPEGGAR